MASRSLHGDAPEFGVGLHNVAVAHIFSPEYCVLSVEEIESALYLCTGVLPLFESVHLKAGFEKIFLDDKPHVTSRRQHPLERRREDHSPLVVDLGCVFPDKSDHNSYTQWHKGSKNFPLSSNVLHFFPQSYQQLMTFVT